MSRIAEINFQPMGIRNMGSYYQLTEKPVLTLNLEHGLSALKGRDRLSLTSTSQPNIVISGLINDTNKKNLIVAQSNGNRLADFNLNNPSLLTPNFYSAPRMLHIVYFNEHYFIGSRNNTNATILYRLNRTNQVVQSDGTNGFTFPSEFIAFNTFGTYNNSLWISHLTEPILAYGSWMQIQGTLNEFDVAGIGTNAPIVAIADVSLQQTGTFKTFLVLIQEDGNTLLYTGVNPNVDFSLAYKLKISGFLKQIRPVVVGTDLFVLTEDGLFSLKGLLSSTGMDFYKLNLFEPILPLYRSLVDYIADAGFLVNNQCLWVSFRRRIDENEPFRIRPNSPTGELGRFRLVEGSTVIMLNLLTNAISIWTFQLSNTLPVSQTYTAFFEDKNDIYAYDATWVSTN